MSNYTLSNSLWQGLVVCLQTTRFILLSLYENKFFIEYYQLETRNYFLILASIVTTLVKIRQELGDFCP